MGSFSAEEYFYKVENMVFSSTHILRKLFEIRWKETMREDWEHTEEQGSFFLQCEEGKQVNKTASKLQKEKIQTGCLDTWDMTLLSMVLRNFGEEELYNKENEAVKQLTKLRNKQKHIPYGKLSREEYDKKVEVFRKILEELRVDSEEIDKIIEKAGITSSVVAWKATKKLLEKGDEHLKAEEFEQTIACFDEATTMHSLLPVHEGIVYEKRANCYLKRASYLKGKQKGTDVEQAMLDATFALERNYSSWNAHYLIAQCHRMNRCYDEAIQHYESALALSLVQKHVKSELDSCKVLLIDRTTRDNLQPFKTPLVVGDLVTEWEAKAGFKLGWTDEQILRFETAAYGPMFLGQDSVFEGLKHFYGWLVPKNEEEATRCYAKAADVGNVRGVSFLANCYRDGKGVEQDLEKAYQLYFQAANMSPSPKHFCVPSCTLKNGYVALSQFILGTWYHNGIVVKQDYTEAVMWYKKAVKNENGEAANNLGRMYAEGLGVPRNEKKAVMYWTLAINLKNPNAVCALMHYYIREMEPEKARAMFLTGKEMGSVELSGMSEEEFDNLVKSRLSGLPDLKTMEKDVIEHERTYQLDIKGMTFFERLQRKINYEDSPIETVLKCFCLIGDNDSSAAKLNSLSKSDLKIIERKAVEGSRIAQKVLKTIAVGIELCNFIFENEFESENVGNHNHALDLLYEWCTGEFHVVSSWLCSSPVKNKLKGSVSEWFDKKCGVTGDNDMKIRFCYVCYLSVLAQQSPDSFLIELLKESLKMYPENVHYYDLLATLCDLNGDSKSGLDSCLNGLKRFPDNVNLLYWRAAHLNCHMILDPGDGKKVLENCSRSEKRVKNIVAAYMEFLNKAPPDHPFVPKAFYSLAHIYMEDVLVDKVSGIRKVERYFNLGKKSEENLLPCHLQRGKSIFQKIVETFLLVTTAATKLEDDGGFNPEQQYHDAPEGILERKPYLRSLQREQVVLEHRKTVRKADKPLSSNLHKPKLSQVLPKRMGHLKPITLKEMNLISDEIYEDRVLDLTIIEDPFFGSAFIHLVAEDENGDVTRLHVYNIAQNTEVETNLAHGSKIGIMNPYMRIGRVDEKNAIRNDEPRCILYLGKVENMCRFCGEENAERKCAKCKKLYCSRECQELDWKLLKHKLVCSV